MLDLDDIHRLVVYVLVSLTQDFTREAKGELTDLADRLAASTSLEATVSRELETKVRTVREMLVSDGMNERVAIGNALLEVFLVIWERGRILSAPGSAAEPNPR